MKIATVVLLSICLMAIGVGSIGARQDTANLAQRIDCKECHLCVMPTAKEPCLKPCPTLAMTHTTSTHKLAEAPDTMLLKELADTYQPVHFNHKLHAGMAEMGDSCATCHHYSPPGRIPPCKECHGNGANPRNLRQPGLKGAYHRHCLSCHREWSHDTKCVVCHLPKLGEKLSVDGIDSTDILGVAHPVITVPPKKVFETPYKAGPVVTFQHKEHVDLFGLKCVNCHHEENCGYCHDLQRPVNTNKTQEQVHAICNDCHKADACSKCHDTKERPGFSHSQIGWALGPYHDGLDCRACHPTGKRIAKLNRSCSNCHAGWNQGNFKHAVTGLKLDEAHAELECTSCHLERRFDSDPVCAECHDDDRTWQTHPPGTKVKR